MAADKIGYARCPVCSSGKATVSLSKKSLACLTCNDCNTQVFARSGRSDELIRDRITGPIGSASATAPAAAPVAPVSAPVAPIPSPTPRAAPVAPVAAPAAAVPAAKPASRPFGLIKWP